MNYPDTSVLYVDFIPTLSEEEQEFVNTYQIFAPEPPLPAGDMYRAWARDIWRRANIWLQQGRERLSQSKRPHLPS